MPNPSPSYILSSESRGFVLSFATLLGGAAIVFVIATELLIRYEVDPAHSFFRYVEFFRSSQSKDAAFGDSMIVSGFTGQPGFVNLAMGGDDVRQVIQKVKAYYATRPAGRVIVQAAPHHFSPKYSVASGDDPVIEYLSQGGPKGLRITNRIYRNELVGFWRVYLSKGYFEQTTNFEADGARLAWRWLSKKTEAERRSSAAQSANNLRPKPGFENSEKASIYADMLDYLVGKGANICLVNYPVSRGLRRVAENMPEFAAAREFFAGLAKARSITYVDLFDYDLDDAFFIDDNHLNGDGAPILSPLIVERCYGKS
jgi:hypothetical protein